MLLVARKRLIFGPSFLFQISERANRKPVEQANDVLVKAG
jgi:hypothetical protein